LPLKTLRTTVAALALLLIVPLTAHAATFSNVGSALGPLTSVNVGSDLSCQAKHRSDNVMSFFPSDKSLGDCGTLLATDGQLFAPDFASHGKTSTQPALGPVTPFTQVSQSAVTGAGTSSDPFRVTTVADVGGTGLRVTEVDSYAAGGESYRTDVTVANSGAATKTVVLYRAADCHLQNDDSGFGFVETALRAVGCSVTGNNQPPGRIEEWVPITGGNNYLEDEFNNGFWQAVASQQSFPDACVHCGDKVDNAAGISWRFDVAAGGSATRSHYTTFSPSSNTGTPDTPISAPGSGGGNTTGVGNGNSITIDVPKGCVKPPKPAKVRVTSKRKRGLSADRFGFVRRVKILRVDFTVDGKGRIRDKKAAFKAFLATTGLSSKVRHTIVADVLLQRLRARGRQVLIGRKFHARVSAGLSICP
jgi:hypothetical protein